jgi:hypothetical protein
MTSISYAVTVCNEYAELKTLISKLTPHITSTDELIILVDATNCTANVRKLCDEYDHSYSISIFYHNFDRDFAAHKNYLNSKCTKDWIFNIDADEYPTEYLLTNLKSILDANPEVDVFAVPRINTVDGLTPEHISRWGWVVDSNSRVNWPDYQTRIYKNKPNIAWHGKVHEVVKGWSIGSHLPCDNEDYALVHPKDIARQERQNNLYNNITK